MSRSAESTPHHHTDEALLRSKGRAAVRLNNTQASPHAAALARNGIKSCQLSNDDLERAVQFVFELVRHAKTGVSSVKRGSSEKLYTVHLMAFVYRRLKTLLTSRTGHNYSHHATAVQHQNIERDIASSEKPLPHCLAGLTASPASRTDKLHSSTSRKRALHKVVVAVGGIEVWLFQQVKLKLVPHEPTNATKALDKLVALLRSI